MKSILLLTVAVASITAQDFPSGDIGVDVFGLSYHSNKNVIYNQVNPGIGLTVGLNVTSWLDVVACGGTYKDSYFAQARYAMGGLRLVVGDRDGFNAKLAMVYGYLDGSDKNGLKYFPVLSVGYDRVSICVTGDPSRCQNPNFQTNNSKDYTTGMVAVFADITLYKF